MTDPNFDGDFWNGVAERAERIRGHVDQFVADLKEQQIHVGLGQNPICVTCEKPWPCPDERKATNA